VVGVLEREECWRGRSAAEGAVVGVLEREEW
jgi:hypothetical protein